MDKFLVPIDFAQSDTVTNPAAGFTRVQAFTDGSVRSISPAGVQTNLSTGAVSMQSARLTATQANSTVTPAVLTGHTFTIPPGKTALINATLVFTAAATTTGGLLGIRVAQAAGANGNAQGSWFGTVAVTSAAGAGSLEDGDVYNVAAAANAIGSVLGTASTAGNQGSQMTAIVQNTSTNANTTVTVEFASEVAASAVTAQIGTSATCIVG